MKDTLEIIQDYTFPRTGASLVIAPTYYARLNGVPMDLGEAVETYMDNEENPPLKFPPIPGFAWGPRTKAKPAACSYCASIITGNRCESCGAPKRAEKPKEQEWPILLHDSGPVREGDGWRRTRITACPPKTP